MTYIVAVVAFLVAAAASAPEVRAASCDVAPTCATARTALDAACPCGAFASRRAYRHCVRAAIRRTGGCRRGLACIARHSTCGRRRAVVCCRADDARAGVVRRSATACTSGRRPGTVCAGTSVDDACAADGTCRTTTTTSTTTSTVPTSLPEAPPSTGFLDLTITRGIGGCGTVSDASGAKVGSFTCGGLTLGGDTSVVPESPVPEGSISRFALDCAGDACALSPMATVAAPATCTTMGCPFGAPIPVVPGGATDLCLMNTLAAPATGTLDRSTGAMHLSTVLRTSVFLTWYPGQVYTAPDSTCPVCQEGGLAVNGSPAAPATGTCNGGARATLPCTSTNSDGLTPECPPGGPCDESDPGCAAGMPCEDGVLCADGSLHLGSLRLDPTPFASATVRRSSPDGRFCFDAAEAIDGCTGAPPACRTVDVVGRAARVPIVEGVPSPLVLASVFCIPHESGDLGLYTLLDAMMGLPGRGVLSLPATVTVHASGE